MPPLPNPTIVLPGIMGSALRDEYPVEPETVWSLFRLVIKSYERLTPHPTDTRFELHEPARVTADQVFGLVYAELVEELRHNLSPQADQPVPVYPFAYDWRQPLELIESQLAAFVDEVIDRTRLLRHYDAARYGSRAFPARVNLVGHSMGGLIIAGYLQKHGPDKVARVATIASPFRGSIEPVAKTAIGVSTLGLAAGGSREREAARVTPALYYLLPSFRNAVASDPGLSDDLFVPEAWQPGILQSLASFIRLYGLRPDDPPAQAQALLGAMLDRAWRYRNRLERLVLDEPKAWLSIVGVNEPTRVALRIRKDPAGAPMFELADTEVQNEWSNPDPRRRVDTGDNTVPYLGARAKFIPVEQVVCVTPQDFGLWEIRDRLLELGGLHSALPNMNLVQRLVVSHLRGAAYGDVWGRCAPDLPDPSGWDPPIAGLRRR